jgi:hypothetical protein
MTKLISKTLFLIFVSFIIIVLGSSSFAKPRTVVTTDGEIDDMDSFIRFLLYTNEMDVDGLIYSSSMWHWAGDGKGTVARGSRGNGTSYRWCGTTWMEYYIDEYARVYENLKKHSPDYPTPEYLKSIIRIGNIEFEAEMTKETAGANFIKDILLDADTQPVYLQVWGGTNTIARALKTIEEQYKNTDKWDDIYKKVSTKAVIYTILDQDSTYREYVSVSWPQVKVIYNSSQFWSFAYQWTRSVPAELRTYLDGKWFAENIKLNHGPLMAAYLSWGDNHKDWGDPDDNRITPEQAQRSGRTIHDFISEGDSPAYFFLVDVGLRSMEDPSYGGWGGRFVKSSTNQYRWEDGKGVTDFDPYTNTADTAYPQTRWVNVLQNDLAARADWCVAPYEKANHAPIVKLNSPADLKVKPGAVVQLEGTADDPDKNQLKYRWWQYAEADTYQGTVELTNSDSQKASFTVPADAKTGDTIHTILEVSDSGSPSLTGYQRVIVTILPNK